MKHLLAFRQQGRNIKLTPLTVEDEEYLTTIQVLFSSDEETGRYDAFWLCSKSPDMEEAVKTIGSGKALATLPWCLTFVINDLGTSEANSQKK